MSVERIKSKLIIKEVPGKLDEAKQSNKMKCYECEKDCSRSNIVCGLCGHMFHISCAPKGIPNMTAALIETIKKSQGALLYRCGQCFNLPSQNTSGQDNVGAKLEALETKIEKVSKLLMDNVLPQLNSIKSDIENCLSRIETFEKGTNSKIDKLVVENNHIRKQLNRCDILVSGLPKTLTNDGLYEVVDKIGNVLDVKLEPYDIHLCTWIRNKKVLLVKFNSVRKRDKIFSNYIKTKNLQLNHVINTDIEARVYINEHLTPIAANMQYFCRKLLKEKKITKYFIKNSSVPEVKLVLANGSEKNVRFDQINDFTANAGALETVGAALEWAC